MIKMKTLYLECHMGVAGDMLMSALYELLSEQQKKDFLYQMEHIGIEGLKVVPKRVQRCGIYGTQMQIVINGQEEGVMLHSHDEGEAHEHEHHHHHSHHHVHEHNDNQEHSHVHEHDHNQEHNHHHEHSHSHHHYTYQEIVSKIHEFQTSDAVKEHASQVYHLIGEAESKVHGVTIENIHFHEVGSLDAIADITGCALLLDMLKVDQVIASPIHVGNGTVSCAHGILPVPAPATAYILLGIPYYSKDIMSELCTPTGASLLKHYVKAFQAMPTMDVKKMGYGMGKKEFKTANCIRAFLGDTIEDITQNRDKVIEIHCNLDDMTAEEIGYTIELLLKKGALDVFTTPIMMKKNRPATMLSCLCKCEEKKKFIDLLLQHTTTLGVRYQEYARKILTSKIENVETEYGMVRVKHSSGYGIEKVKIEYDDIKKLADTKEIPFHVMKEGLMKIIKKK